MREPIGDWLFGCDVCQEVCPWNRKSTVTDEPKFTAIQGHNPIELRPLFSMNDDDFRARFRKTPLWRSKRRGILRNAAIVLGNRPDPENEPALIMGLADPEPLVRGACAWALGKHGATNVLQERQKIESDEVVLRELKMALDKTTNELR